MKGTLSPLVRAMLRDPAARAWLRQARDGDRYAFRGRVYVYRSGR
jgi:hypothetical protein